jgi:hypothetical protein
MSRLLIAAAVLMSAMPALAQSEEERVNQLIIYGDDKCPESKDNEITVCARKAEQERYRIPENLRESTSVQNGAWNNRVLAYETIGKTGTLSCSPVGPGGFTGCLNKIIDTAYAEKRGSPDIRFSELIAAERAKRLATIDAEAAEMQARVEVAEREYAAKQRALQDPESVTPAPQPAKPAGQ